MDIVGKSIIVTGAGAGIGAAAAELAAARGARVTIADLNEEDGHAVLDRILAAGGEAQFVRTDIAVEGEVEAMVAAAVSRFGGLDGAFNNAGIPSVSHRGKGSQTTLFVDMPPSEMRRTMEVNVIGTFFCMRAELRVMLAGGGGSIVNTASNAGILAILGAADYIASKHAVIGLTKSAALDYAKDNIRVNAVLPGVVRTKMMEISFAENPALVEWAASVQPNGRVGVPSEIGEAALWLLSDAASFVTGVSLSVDGGFSMT